MQEPQLNCIAQRGQNKGKSHNTNDKVSTCTNNS